MILRVKYSLFATICGVVWLLAGLTTGLAQTGPNSASLVKGIEDTYKVQVVGSLCPATPSAGASQTGCNDDGTYLIDLDNTAQRNLTSWTLTGPNTASAVGATFNSLTFTSPGTYTVSVARSYTTGVSSSPTSTTTASFTLLIGERPPAFEAWKSEHIICKGQPLTLDPYNGNSPSGPNSTSLTYLWAGPTPETNGKTTQTLSVTAGGCYSVEVFTPYGCSTQERTQVEVCPPEPPQPQGVKWYFGANAGLDFAGGSPSPLTDSKVNTREGTASITDTRGELRFYTDGITVFDKDGNPMRIFNPISGSLTSNSAVLGGASGSTQSALIVPKSVCRGCEYLYYVYTTAEINGTRQLAYSIVDMRRNNGTGAVVQQNIPVVPVSATTTSTERSASILQEGRDPNDPAYWVITHDFGTNCFRINQLSSSSSALLSSTATCGGTPHDSPARGEGQMKFGPAPSTPGSNTAVRQLAVVVPGDPASTDPARRKNLIEIFSFNTETGVLSGSPTRTIDAGEAPPTAYGTEFSPDGSKLYVTFLGATSANSGTTVQYGPSRILQYDLSDPTSTSALLEESTTRQYGQLQIGPDGRIYVAVPNSTSLAIIDNANNSLSAVSSNPGSLLVTPASFTLNGQDLGGNQSQLGLPNQVKNFNEPSSSAGVSATNVCVGNPVDLQITPLCPKLKEEYRLQVFRADGSEVATGFPSSFTQTQQSLSGLTAGVYSVTLTTTVTNTAVTPASVCTVVTSNTSFTVIPEPGDIDLGADRTICTSSNEPLSFSINVTADLYAWGVRQLNGRITLLRAGPNERVFRLNPPFSGTLVAVAGNGDGEPFCPKFDDIKVDLRQPGNLDLGGPKPLCQGGTQTLAVQSSSFSSYTWTAPDGSVGNNRSTIASAPGTYSIAASYVDVDGITCTAFDSQSVISVPNPVLTPAFVRPSSCTIANGAITVDTPVATTIISGSPTTGTSFTYAWQTVVPGTPVTSNTNSISAVAEGVYSVSVTDANQCSTTATYPLQSTAQRLVLTPSKADAQCGDPQSGTIAVRVSNGTLGTSQWLSPPGASITSSGTLATGLSAGSSYTFVATNDAGCISTTTASIASSTTATLSLANRTRCTGDTLLLVPSRLGNFTSGITYLWSNGQTSNTISAPTAGPYSVTVTHVLTGCVGSATATAAFIPKPTLTLQPNNFVCVGTLANQTFAQTFSPAGGSWTSTAGVVIDPQGGGFTPQPLPTGLNSQTATLIYSYTAPGTACATAAPREVDIRRTPTVNAGPDDQFCFGAKTIQATGSAGASFRWSDGTLNSILRPAQSGTYVVTATLNGCSSTDDVVVTVDPAPTFGITSEAFICVGDGQQTRLQVVPQGTGPSTVEWLTGNVTSTTLATGTPGTYSVVVTGANGCTATGVAAVRDRCEPRVFMPNAFSPNGSGPDENERFRPYSAYATNIELRIFNRWGEVIFASTPNEPDWDGTYRGEPAPSMVYPYTISYKSEYFPDRPAVVKRGSVLLLR